jgi:hypothetical protein
MTRLTSFWMKERILLNTVSLASVIYVFKNVNDIILSTHEAYVEKISWILGVGGKCIEKGCVGNMCDVYNR